MLRQRLPISVALLAIFTLAITMPLTAQAVGDPVNCPRPAAYWAKQCEDDDWYGDLPGSAMLLVAEEVGHRSSFFVWPPGTELDRLATVISPPPPGTVKELAHREFATMLSTIGAGLLGIRNANDEPLGLEGDSEISCDGLGFGTLDALVEEIDSLLIVLDLLPEGDTTATAIFQSIVAALQDINNGIGIKTTCDLENTAPPFDGGGGYMVIGLGDHEPDCPDSCGEGGDPG